MMDYHDAMVEGGRQESGRGVFVEHGFNGMPRVLESNESPNFQSQFLRRHCLWKLLLQLFPQGIDTEYSKLFGILQSHFQGMKSGKLRLHYECMVCRQLAEHGNQ